MPRELGRRLDAAALVEELALGLDLDLVRAQVVGDLERELARSHRCGDAGSPARPEDQLGRQLVPGQPLLDQLVEPELLERNGFEAVELAQAGNLERADVGRARPVSLHVHERVGNGEGHLVPKLGRADRVAEDDDVGHGSGS